MRVDLSHASLLSFDAKSLSGDVGSVYLSADDVASQSSEACDALSSVTTLVLAHNALRQLKGTAALQCLGVLDVSHNNLAVLHGKSLPMSLTLLNVSHNKLRKVQHLASALPQLVTLDASYNYLSAEGIESLPPNLRSLDLSYNELTTLDFVSSLRCLTNLSVTNNRFRRIEDIRSVSRLPNLRRFDVRHNSLLCEGHEASREHILVIAQYLSHLNGMAVSSTTAREARSLLARSSAKSATGSKIFGTSSSSSLLTDATRSGHVETVSMSRHSPFARAPSNDSARKDLRLMRVKLDELQRLVLASRRAEAELREQHALLLRQVKQCNETSSAEANEVVKVQREIDDLTTEESELRATVQQLEHTFEQTHASFVATKYPSSLSHLRGGRAST